jgi:hypothetical protein
MSHQLLLDDVYDQVEFQIRTWQAVMDNEIEFEFQGFTVMTAAAIDVVNDIVDSRTYH